VKPRISSLLAAAVVGSLSLSALGAPVSHGHGNAPLGAVDGETVHQAAVKPGGSGVPSHKDWRDERTKGGGGPDTTDA
jgi:hypothetical protein